MLQEEQFLVFQLRGSFGMLGVPGSPVGLILPQLNPTPKLRFRARALPSWQDLLDLCRNAAQFPAKSIFCSLCEPLSHEPEKSRLCSEKINKETQNKRQTRSQGVCRLSKTSDPLPGRAKQRPGSGKTILGLKKRTRKQHWSNAGGLGLFPKCIQQDRALPKGQGTAST